MKYIETSLLDAFILNEMNRYPLKFRRFFYSLVDFQNCYFPDGLEKVGSDWLNRLTLITTTKTNKQ